MKNPFQTLLFKPSFSPVFQVPVRIIKQLNGRLDSILFLSASPARTRTNRSDQGVKEIRLFMPMRRRVFPFRSVMGNMKRPASSRGNALFPTISRLFGLSSYIPSLPEVQIEVPFRRQIKKEGRGAGQKKESRNLKT